MTKAGGADWLSVGTKAEGETSWVAVVPDHGDEAGAYSIRIELGVNATGEDRSATITITCGATVITITVTQKGTTESGEVPEEGTDPVVPGTTTYPHLVSRIEFAYIVGIFTKGFQCLYEFLCRPKAVSCIYLEVLEGFLTAQNDVDVFTVGCKEAGCPFVKTAVAHFGYVDAFIDVFHGWAQNDVLAVAVQIQLCTINKEIDVGVVLIFRVVAAAYFHPKILLYGEGFVVEVAISFFVIIVAVNDDEHAPCR